MPNIIVVMGEAFADLRVYGDLNTDQEVMPFFDSLHENTIRGYALASIFGGGTCNSEYEVLTGNTMAFFPDGSYPYQQYIQQDSWSLALQLNQMGYNCMATHPNRGENWMRKIVWPLLGFDETKYIEAYSLAEPLREYVSDQAMYDQIISWYEERETDEKKFLFGVTMQNHSPFNYAGSGFSTEIHLEGYSQPYPDVEQYLTLLHYSDQALEKLVNYFEQVDENVILVFFGDHQPRINTKFYEELYGSGFDCLEDQMLRYVVPFFVWANYDIEEQQVEMTSLNFLSNYIYEVAGIELPAYNKFLQYVNETIPAMNAFGYYSRQAGNFVLYDDALGEEKDTLEEYRFLQYHCLTAEYEASKVFFPIIR